MGYMGLRVDEELEDVVPPFWRKTAIFSVPAPGRELPEELPVPRFQFLGSPFGSSVSSVASWRGGIRWGFLFALAFLGVMAWWISAGRLATKGYLSPKRRENVKGLFLAGT